MIKKSFAIIMATLLTISFTACTNSDDSIPTEISNNISSSDESVESEPNSESSAITNKISDMIIPSTAGPLLKEGLKNFFDKMDKDKYYLKYSIECLTDATDGKVRKAENTIVRDDDKMSSNLIADDMNSGNKQIVKGGKVYEIDDANKKVTWANVESNLIDNFTFKTASIFYINSLELCGSGKEKIGDKEYDYEEYKQPGDTVSEQSDDNKQRARYYFDNGMIVSLKNTNGNFYYTTTILELNDKIPDKEFDYPSDYKLEERLELSEDSSQ